MPLTFAHLVRQRPVEENDRLPRRDPPRLSEAARTYGKWWSTSRIRPPATGARGGPGRRYPARGRTASKRPPRHMRLALPIVGVGVVGERRARAHLGSNGKARS